MYDVEYIFVNYDAQLTCIIHTHLPLQFYVNTVLHQAFHHYIKVVSTTLDLGGKFGGSNSLLAYQMVQASQMMMVSALAIFVVRLHT
ncbi:hypothetical protein EON65_26305, partial [archaeon]